MDKETRKKIHNLVDQIMDLLERNTIEESNLLKKTHYTLNDEYYSSEIIDFFDSINR